MTAMAYDNDEPRDREIQGAIEAVDAMVEIVDGFEEYVLVAAVTAEHSTRYRLNLLWVHTLSALCMAPLLGYTGREGMTGPSFAFLRTLPGSPHSLAAVLAAGGLTLGMGCVFRAKRVEIAGLIILGLFYLLFAISLAVPPINWIAGDSAIKPPMYGSVIYLHLTIIMVLHVYGLVVKIRDERVRKRIADRGK